MLEKKKLGILLKVVTLGGVADQAKIQKMMTMVPDYNFEWLNFKSRSDYTVRYLYRICTLGQHPIGSAGVKKVPGHDVENWEMDELVTGHLDFRSHLYGLCLMAGLKHD